MGPEETLDPSNWEELHTLGHQMVDEMLTYLATVRDRPLWQPLPDEVKAFLQQPLPLEPQGEAQAYADFQKYILPNPMGNIHPRFWGWVIGTGTPYAMLAEMLAAGFNPNVGGGDHVANYVEAQVLEWCKQMLGYPGRGNAADASGILVSGGSMANLVGLTIARNIKAGWNVREKGLTAGPRLTMYGSRETHSSVGRGIEVLGMGEDSFRQVPVGSDYEIDLSVLERTLAEDRAAGLRPICIIGNAGTVNTGAIDPLDALADLCEREGLWFHVDGAFGALAALAPDLRPRLKGMERADSLAFDLHKWMYMPIEVGCTLVRRRQDQVETFAHDIEYLAHTERGLAGGSLWFSEMGIQLSRGFRALKVWMSLKAHGAYKFGRLIQQNVEQAGYLCRLVQAHPRLELMAPAPLNIVCFRYRAKGLDDAALNALNKELLIRLHESGLAAPSYTTLEGRYTLRAAIVNHRSRLEDFDLLVREVVRIGDEMAAAMHGS